MRLFIAFGIVLWTAGCLMVPVPTSEVVLSGRYIAESELGFLKNHQTTKYDVLTQLGPATIWLKPQRTLVYGLVKTAKTGLFWIIGGGAPGALGGVAGGVLHFVDREALFIVFDETDTLVDSGQVKVENRVTWLSAALAWGRSKGLKLAEPQVEFAETVPPLQQSIIYFYRPRDIQHVFPGFPPAESILFGLDPFPEVYLNAALVGQIRRKSYLTLTLDPGTYEFRFVPLLDNPDLNYRDASIQITVQPDLEYFVDVRIETGKGISQPVVSQRSREEAIPLLQLLRETW